MEQIIKIEVDSTDLDEALDKANRLIVCLKEVEQIAAPVIEKNVDDTGKLTDRMLFRSGEIIRVDNKTLFEIAFADTEKAVCLKLKWCDGIGWTQTGKHILVSNKPSDYERSPGFEPVPSISVVGKYHWEPIKTEAVFPMV